MPESHGSGAGHTVKLEKYEEESRVAPGYMYTQGSVKGRGNDAAVFYWEILIVSKHIQVNCYPRCFLNRHKGKRRDQQ